MNRPDSNLVGGIDLSTVRSFLPGHARRILDTCPSAGTGVHFWLYAAACALARAGVDPNMAARLIRDGSGNCGRYVEAREIAEAIRSAARAVGISGDVTLASEPRPKAWPAPNFGRIEAIAVTSPGLAGLQALSPVKFRGDDRNTEEIVDHLFHDHELVCAGHDKKAFETKTRAEWRGDLASMPFIVPSPMSALTGITTGGRTSARTLSNTGPRRYLPIEFDFAERDKSGRDTSHAPMLRALADDGITVLDLCASMILHLAQYGPLVVFSGGKPLHGWFHCDGQPEEQVRLFMHYAVGLGADPATWTRNQMVRMPDGTRADGNGARQTVHYFNPEVAHVG